MPYQSFPTADSTIVVGALNNKQFKIVCTIVDLPALITDPRFATNPDRVQVG